MPKTNSSSISSLQRPRRPTKAYSKPSVSPTPDNTADELQTLAKTSSGASEYNGYRGLVPNQGRHNHENFTVGAGLENFNPDRDQHPASVEQCLQETLYGHR